ncbi:MAG TPA: hypothetical protein VMU67_07750 [Steroidobacteraceae bacterium]|nr:hypothetical protein [Steroidobacteraceae bacterium]
MSGSRLKIVALAAAGALYVALAGCVVAPGPGGLYVGPAVSFAPPQPYVESYGVAPYPGYIWFGGYWNWVGGRYIWVRGHWGAPRAGFRWVPNRWVRGGDGWHMQRGHWARR